MRRRAILGGDALEPTATATTIRGDVVTDSPCTETKEALVVSEPTMAARVTRAKKKIVAARIAYRVPGPAELPDRLDAVLTVAHLLYTAGHTTPGGDSLVRPDLVDRALGLARMIRELMPDEPEASGLLALLLLTDARRASRTDDHGNLVLLERQDRSRWDAAAIAAGAALVGEALRGKRPGRFALKAAIAAVPAEAPTCAETDWPQLLFLCDRLLRRQQVPAGGQGRPAAQARPPRRCPARLPRCARTSRERDRTGLPHRPDRGGDGRWSRGG